MPLILSMVFVTAMVTQDNDPTFNWTSIGLQTALILNKLRIHSQLNNNVRSMNPSEGLTIDSVSNRWIIEATKMDVLSEISDICPKGLPAGGIATNTSKSRSIVTEISSVGLINEVRHVSKIDEPVVQTVSVDVVNFPVWPFAVNDQPNNAMNEIYPPAERDLEIGPVVSAAGDAANEPTPTPLFPAEFSCVGVVRPFFSSLFGSQHLSPGREEDQKQGDRNADRSDPNKQNSRTDSEYIDRRLRELASFERRASGMGQTPRRKRE